MSQQKNLSSGGSMSVIIISFIYATINEISSDITFATSTGGEAQVNFGIFVPATAAILFGKGIGGASAGLGGLLTEIQLALFSDQSAGLDMSVVIASFAAFVGAYTTGYLTESKKVDDLKSKGIQTSKGVKEILQDTAAAVIGMAMTSSFLEVYSNQIRTNESITKGSSQFLALFFGSAIVLVISIPIAVFAFDRLEAYLRRKGQKLDLISRELEWSVPDPGDAEIESITLPEHAFLKNIWTTVVLKFKNKTGKETAFDIEGVSTAQIYPHLDTSKVIADGESWTQTFYVLPGKQEKVNLRFRITPKVDKQFKAPIIDDAIVDASGKVLDPSKNSIGLAQFGGVNFSVLGLSIIWQDIVDAIGNPSGIIDGFRENTSVLFVTGLVELAIFAPVIFILYKLQKRKQKLDTFQLAFSEDLESHGYEEKAKKSGLEAFLKYQRFLYRLITTLLALATVGSIVYLGYEGYKSWDDPSYETSNPEIVLIGSVVIMIFWIIGLRGLDALQSLGMKRLPPWVLKPGDVILNFNPTKPFQEGIPNEVIVMAQNPTDKPGIRIVFQGQDTVSPSMVELHIAPGEIVSFKVAITPLHKETSDILAVTYPFFDSENNLLDFDQTEPIFRQDISYEVMGQTRMGLTQGQQKRLMQAGGFGSVIGVAITFLNQLFPDYPQITELIKESGPYFAALQAPFVYGYFYYQNKIRGGKTGL